MATFYRHFKPPKDTVSKIGSVVSELEEELSRVFEGTTIKSKQVLEVEGTVPTVCKNPKELSKVQNLSLRSSIQTITSENVELKQFDPNFFSRGNIWCRYPGCKQRRSRQYKFDGTKPPKEDLYLCPSHRNNLEDKLAKMCAQKGVSNSTKNTRPEDLKGYTSMIGLLESGYHSLTKPTTPWRSDSKNTAILQEVCLNMRNYLIIVNALLNPIYENLIAALTAPLSLIKQILEILRDNGEAILETLTGLVELLKQAMEHILFTFGIIYSWVYLSLIGNPGAQLGAGIGGFIGLIGYAGGPVIGTLTAAGGAIFGGLIGSGWYNLSRQRENGEGDNERFRAYQQFAQVNIRVQGDADQQLQAMPQQPTEEECAVYYLTGSSTGDLVLAVLFLCITI